MKTAEVERYLVDYSRISSGNKINFEKLRAVLSQMQKEGIDCILLKGADLIHRLYGVLGVRPLGDDADLLVHESDLPAIDRLLTQLGYCPRIDGNPAYVDPGNTLALDIITKVWYVDDQTVIWQRAIQRDFEGIPVKGLGRNDLLVYLTAYNVVHRGYLSASFARDIALLTDAEAIDWPFILTEATRLMLKVPLYHGFAYAIASANAKIPPEVMRQLSPSSLSEKFLRFLFQRLVTERQIPRIGFFLLFMTKPGSEQVRWLKTALFPPTVFLRYRYGVRTETRPVLIRLVRPWHLLFQASLLSGRILLALFKKH